VLASAGLLAPVLQSAFAAEPSRAGAAPAQRPAQRIVTLAPHLTELVFTVGAGDRLVGVDAYSDYPPAARDIARVGDAFQVDYERLLALRPDLVLVWTTGMPEAVMKRIADLGLRVERVSIARLADISQALKQIGALTGQGEQAQRAAEAFAARVADLEREHAGRAPVTVFYQISETPLYTVSGKHVISEMIELCGGRNVFADLQQLAPPVGLEAVIERNPQAIITADGAQGEPLSVWRRWPDVKAVRLGNLYTVNADQVARPTTRIVLGAAQICAAIDSARRRLAANQSP
jgi:iron complex transport system substrate-binding protein